MSNEGFLKFIRNETEKDLVTVIQEETDDKVSVRSQNLTEEQKAQVVQNLEGTFLPLSGGTITGTISDASGRPIASATSSNQVTFCGGTRNEDGAWLALFGNDIDDPRARGFTLSNGNNISLAGLKDNSLTWGGKEIERVSQVGKGADLPDGSSQHYIRFESGLQLVFGTATVNGVIEEQKRVTLIVPFISNAIVVASNDANIGPQAAVCVGWQDTTGFSIGTNLDGVTGHCRWIAIGFWK